MRQLIFCCALAVAAPALAQEPPVSDPWRQPGACWGRYIPYAFDLRAGSQTEAMRINADGSVTIYDRPRVRHLIQRLPEYAGLFRAALNGSIPTATPDEADQIARAAGAQMCAQFRGDDD